MDHWGLILEIFEFTISKYETNYSILINQKKTTKSNKFKILVKN